LNWAFVEGPIGGVKATLGRQNFALNSKTILDCEFDGAKFVYGKDVKVTGFYGRTSNATSAGGKTPLDNEDFYAVDVNTKVAGIPVYATYYDSDFQNKEIWNLGLSLPVAKDLVLKADYMYGDSDMADVDDNGYVATLAYKGAKASAPGSYGVWATYYDQPANCYFKPTLNTQSGYAETWDDANYGGYEGFEIGANYALAKNIVAAVRYFDIESQKEVAGKICSDEVLWTEVVFTF